MLILRRLSISIGLLSWPSLVLGQNPTPMVVFTAPAAQKSTLGMITIPALTPLTLMVNTAISSKTAKRGERFPLTMTSDIIVDGVIIVPRGTNGEGEVVHSAGVGFGGRAGELIVAARFLYVEGRKIALQSFRINKAGANNAAEALLATTFIPLAGLIVTGTSAEIPAGQSATAKTALAFSLKEPSATQKLSTEIVTP